MKQQGARPFTTRSLRPRAVLKNAHRLMLHSKELADPVQHHAAFLRGTCSKTSEIYLPVQIWQGHQQASPYGLPVSSTGEQQLARCAASLCIWAEVMS